MCAKQVKKAPAQVETTGHEWDGIEEYNNPLPRWWVWVFTATIVWAIGDTIAYPAWPLLTGATPGVLGSSTRADVQVEVDTFDAKNADIKAKLVAAPLDQIVTTPELMAYAEPAGAAVFRTNCAQCHGAGAAGVVGKGYPNLLDNDWLWGGTIDDIHTTITHGIRNQDSDEARLSMMPVFGNGILTPAQISDVTEYVLALSERSTNPEATTRGATLFTENCTACHGDAGRGNPEFGAPNLTDRIWLHGAERSQIQASITRPRMGVMPAFNQRLDPGVVNMLAVYVHSLGGGR